MEFVAGRLRSLLNRLRLAGESEVRSRARQREIWPDTILWESFGGNGALDNPEALFRRLLDRDSVGRYRHVWALDPGHRAFRDEFRAHPRVRIVGYRSAAYQRALSRASHLVNNATFPIEWGKRAEQSYLNTWHGTPLKHMGFDMPDGAFLSANTLRNFLHADVLLSQSEWMTRRMYLGAYRLEGILPGRILEAGYPRTDRQAVDARTATGLRERWGVGDRRLVVVAPTWTGTNFADPRDDAEEQLSVVTRLQDLLGDRYAVRLKAHQAVHRLVRHHPDAASLLLENDIPTNVILGLTDHLVTDFSSIFFDYLARDRPITFYVPPSSEYRDERGAYFDESELPGPTVRTVEDVAFRIAAPDDPYEPVRREWAERFVAHDDGAASDRVLDAWLEPDPHAAAPPAPRRRALIYLGGMRPNGITSSALNLLAGLDGDHWDVTALMARPGPVQRQNQALIPRGVRQVFRLGGMNGTKLELLRVLGNRTGRRLSDEGPLARRLWRDEWMRIVGGAQFDVVVDYSGYSRFWAQVLLHSDAPRRVIWLHNDMASEIHRTAAGRRPIHRSLPAVLRSLPEFDAAVSVSPRLSELNRQNLAEAYGVPDERFIAARNLVDPQRIIAGSREPLRSLPEFNPPPFLEEEDDPSIVWVAPEWLDAFESPDLHWFVTVGRLSPEKNQARLIEAFDMTHRREPRVRLLLVGDGPLRDRLEADVRRRGLDGAVVFAGRIGNPFPLVAAARAFVLSSNYEGQPMVMLEAALLGLPIITTDFASSQDALPGEHATVVPMSAEALAEAMLANATGAADPPRFDADAYNRAALDDVEAALDGAGSAAPRGAASGTAADRRPRD